MMIFYIVFLSFLFMTQEEEQRVKQVEVKQLGNRKDAKVKVLKKKVLLKLCLLM